MTTMVVAGERSTGQLWQHRRARGVLTDGVHGDAHDNCQERMHAELQWSVIAPSVVVKLSHAITMLNQQTMRSPESSATP